MRLHKLLIRQLKRAGLDASTMPLDAQKWQRFLEIINHTYLEEDNDRYLQDRSMEMVTNELNDLNAKLDLLQKIARIGYWYHNFSTDMNIWSKEIYTIFGIPLGTRVPSLDEIYGLIDEKDRDIFKKCMTIAASTGREFELEIRIKNTSGADGYKWYNIIGQSHSEEDSKDNIVVCIIMDIDLRKRSEEKLISLQHYLIQSEKMAVIGQLSSGIAHEINNPLSYSLINMGTIGKRLSIVSALLDLYQNLMKELKLVKMGELKEIYEKINAFNEEKNVDVLISDLNNMVVESTDGLMRIKEIIANMRNFSGSEKSRMEMFNLNNCLLSAIEVVFNDLKNVCELVTNFSELPEMYGAQNQLMLAFVSILFNAKQAVGENGKVTITTKQEKTKVIVTITDNGCGIAPEHISKLFTPFFTTKSIGAGLGLASAYGIIKLHHGKIDVASKLGEGATFIIELPIEGQKK